MNLSFNFATKLCHRFISREIYLSSVMCHLYNVTRHGYLNELKFQFCHKHALPGY